MTTTRAIERLTAHPPDGLQDWLREATFGEEPPVWQLEPPREVRRQVIELVAGLTADLADIQLRAGGLAFAMPPNARTEGVYALREQLLAVCSAADERRYEFVESDDDEDAIVLAIESTIPEPDVPVVGPGGGLTVVDDGRALRASIAVRSRREQQSGASRWVEPSDVYERIARRFDLRNVEVWAGLGYFEASRFSAQRVLRPAYVFVIDRPQPDEQGPGWRAAAVEPATVVEGLEPWEGLEEWWEAD